ncbi:hypothetical protein JQ620_15770 [Bradyrhizobium sp. AUGA SZCCT0274]|uniref:hypothetical protein n=1 Tax=Bradyrhizobium sp. AUGA SZCCT0274 TaxID=2807670 RepID=UPI001BADBC8A|nr:hypothetical protein [Bradyrhizobium sp. AUGA SZCCT0274]MBR1241587.1 hypothetical protein [Bradyrhizobium sp. AUGA SZCCT0274]
MTVHIPNRSIPPRRHLLRAAFALAQGAANGSEPEKFLTGADPEVAQRIIQRAAVAPGTTTTSGWAAELARDAWRDFLTDLAPYSGAARLIAKALAASVNDVQEAFYPVRAAGATAPAWVGEGDAIPVRSATFSNITIGPAKKQASIVVWSRELGRRSDARNIFEVMMREDTIAGIDGAFFATTAGSAAAHAGLLNGVTAGLGYAGGDEFAIKKDLAGLSDAVATGGSGDVTFIVAPQRFARLKILAPDIFEKLDIAPSAAVPTDRIIAADAAALLVSVDDAPDLDVGDHATLHMSDTPLPISDSGVADPVRSAFQTDSMALRVSHFMAFAKRRSTAVAYLDSATW